jgi:hypothetical protein
MKKATVALAIGGMVAAGGFLGACGTPNTGSAAGSTANTSTGATHTASSNATQVAKSGITVSSDTRCATADLSVSLGAPKKHDDASGQVDVPVTFKNTSSKTCGLYGVPDVSLLGPDDPNGPSYQLVGTDNGVQHNDVEPGMTATATITVLVPGGGAVGSLGSTTWTPTKAQITPPAQSQPLTVDWTSKIAVLRQDSATHPGTFVNGILADPA